MTYEEASKRIEKRICCQQPVQEFCSDNCMNGVNQCEFQLAISAMKKADKYKWHDLRKNPDDLPEEREYGFSDPVLAYDWADYGACRYDFKKNKWYTSDLNFRYEDDSAHACDIVAWRYIEPFKQEEEEKMIELLRGRKNERKEKRK